MTVDLPQAPNTISWYHQAAAAPLRAMASFNLGPLGGENSISAVIEAVLARKRGESIDYPLSKTDQFFVTRLASAEVPDEMIEYRELNHEAQREILRRWSDQVMSVVWLGAGVFTLLHPLLAERKPQDWHVWTDANPKIVQSARAVFDEYRARGETYNLTYDITLPYDVGKLNNWLQLIAANTQHLVINGYGVTYALTMAENYEWLSRLELPAHVDVLFVFNSPGQSITFMPGLMAAFHQQRMVYYDHAAVQTLFAATLPGSDIVWEIPRSATRNGIWGTWLVESTARSRRQPI